MNTSLFEPSHIMIMMNHHLEFRSSNFETLLEQQKCSPAGFALGEKTETTP
jgi:hypothetical protein